MSRITNPTIHSTCQTEYILPSQPIKLRRYAQLPRFLFEYNAFRPMTNEAKVLYAMLLQRAELSRLNRWYDEHCQVYLYYTIEETTSLLHCGRQKAVDTLRELERYSLLEIRRQGCGKPNRIYPKLPAEEPEQSTYRFSAYGEPYESSTVCGTPEE